jgi:hypothetical protein
MRHHGSRLPMIFFDNFRHLVDSSPTGCCRHRLGRGGWWALDVYSPELVGIERVKRSARSTLQLLRFPDLPVLR